MGNIGDTGAQILANVIQDDLWVKALDLQNCGISHKGAVYFDEALFTNKTLFVLDLRLNQNVTHDLLRSLIEQVMVNANGENTEYPWIKVYEDQHQRETNSKKARLNCSRSSLQNKSKEKVPHYPWRTEKRNSQHLLKSDKPYEIGSTVSYTAIQAIDKEKPKKLGRTSINNVTGKGNKVIVVQEKSKAQCKKTPESLNRSSRALYMEDIATASTSEVTLLQREISSLKKQLSLESRARRETERKFEQIQNENRQLYEQL